MATKTFCDIHPKTSKAITVDIPISPNGTRMWINCLSIDMCNECLQEYYKDILPILNKWAKKANKDYDFSNVSSM